VKYLSLWSSLVRKDPVKKTMTLNLTDAEMQALQDLCDKKDLSKTAVLRQALRLYQLVDVRLEQGGKLFFEDEAKKEKAELMVL
jgi:predicted transcriptional regulator